MYYSLAEEATKNKGVTLLNWSDFLLQKYFPIETLNLNLRGAMVPLISTAYGITNAILDRLFNFCSDV